MDLLPRVFRSSRPVFASSAGSRTRAKSDRPGAAPPSPAVPSGPSDRDLRLDLFRGIALWLIFLDHIPQNIVNRFTLRNYGFSDAAEIFIFISGYTAALVYGRSMRQSGFIIAGARILRRAWQIYVAHIFLFTIFMAEVAYVASTFANPLYAEEMNILDFLKNPDTAILEALILRFRPVNMDILPLYIVLMLSFPLILYSLLARPNATLAASGVLYVTAKMLGWNLSGYPDGTWYFNPFAWQFLFVLGAWCALGGARTVGRALSSRTVLAVAIGYLIFAFFVALSWQFESLTRFIPERLAALMYPIDKTNLDPLRLVHFLALATVALRFVTFQWSGLKLPFLQPAIRCGQHSLEIFCLGVFLAFAGRFIISQWVGGSLVQVAISLSGILIMIATAYLIAWYRAIETRSGSLPAKTSESDLAVGGA